MKQKLKFLSILLLNFLLFSCGPTSTPTDPSIDPTSPSVEPSIEPSVENKEFNIKKITVEHLGVYEYLNGPTTTLKYSPYLSETYSVDNILITEFRPSSILRHTVEFEGCYSVDEIEISFNLPEFSFIYDKENLDYVVLEHSGSFPVKSEGNKFEFSVLNQKNFISQFYHYSGTFCLDLYITKVKYNNEWIIVTENNRFITFSGNGYFGYDVIKNTDKEVIIDFSNFEYKDDIFIDKGAQIDNYSYSYYEECIVTISFDFDVFEDGEIVVEVVRQIEIKFMEFAFKNNKPYFELITIYGETELIINVDVKATYYLKYLEFMVDNKLIIFYYDCSYKLLSYNDEKSKLILNKEFKSFIYIGKGYQIDLTETIKNHF